MSFLSFISGKDQQLNSSSSESFLQKNSNPLKKTVRSLRRAASQLSFKISSSKSGQKSTFVGASSDSSLSNTPIIPAETSLDVLEENFDDQDEQTVASTDHEMKSSSPRANFYPFWPKREPNVLKDSGTVVDPSPRNSITENESTSPRYAILLRDRILFLLLCLGLLLISKYLPQSTKSLIHLQQQNSV